MSHSRSLPMETLFKLGWQRASGAVSDQARQSLPIPVRVGAGLQVHFFFAPAALSPREGLRLTAPSYLARIDAHRGTLIDLRAVTPRDFGQSDQPNTPLGAVRLPPDLSADQFVALRTRLFTLYDTLLPQFGPGSITAGPHAREQAREAREIFERLREEPLRHYYSAIGRDFYTWLDALAR